MKRILSFLLALFMIINILCLNVLGENTVKASTDVVNLVKNPGFEADGATVQTPKNWRTWAPTEEEYRADFTVKGEAHSGEYYARHYKDTDYSVSTQTEEMWGLENGKYTVEAWVRSSGGQSTAKLLVYNGAVEKEFSIPQADVWTKIEITDIEVTIGFCNIAFYSVASAGQWIEFDDVSLYKMGDESKPLAFNRISDRNVYANEPLAFRIRAVAADESAVTTYSAIGLPSGALLESDSGVFTWTPSDAQTGEHTVTFIAGTDKGDSDSKTIKITVNNKYEKPKTNLIMINPGFEDDGAETQTPKGWLTWAPTDEEYNADFTVQGNAHSGSYYARHFKETNYAVSTQRDLSGLENGTYTLEAWVRSSGGQNMANMLATPDNDGVMQKKFEISAADQWTKIEITDIKVSKGVCNIAFFSMASAGQWIEFDDVVFYDQNEEPDSGWRGPGPNSEEKVWVAPNSIKILKDQIAQSNTQNTLKIEAAKNEHEGGQIIVTAGQSKKEITGIKVSDFTQGENTILSSSVDVYVQHYMNVKNPTTEFFIKGWYPDAIIPYGNYMQKHKVILVDEGANQGIWFTFKVGKDVPAGLYSGSITLTIDGQDIAVPVTLKVWDFSLTDESHSESSFSIREGYEGDFFLEGFPGVIYDTPEYWKLLEDYYYFHLNYRITPTDLPIPFKNINQFVSDAAKYIQDSRVTAYSIPYKKGDFDNGEASQLVGALKQAGLLEKAYYYLKSEIDEPTQAQYQDVKDFSKKIRDIDPDLRHLVTTYINNEFFGHINTFCSIFKPFDSESYINHAKERQEAGDHIWWYGCVFPKYPYPTYHLDDYLLGARLVSWMQKSIGIEGNLYWATNIDFRYDGTQYAKKDIWRNPESWVDPNTGAIANGEGFLLYPGYEYGIKGPIPSLRLETIRDGNEDYEYLWLLEQKIKAASAKLGIQVNVDDFMKPIYERLFTNINSYTKDPDNIIEARREVAEMIEALDKQPTALVLLGDYTEDKSKREIHLYAEKGSSVEVNGMPVNPIETLDKADKFIVSVPYQKGINTFTVEIHKDNNAYTAKRMFLEKYEAGTTVLEADKVSNGITLDGRTDDAVWTMDKTPVQKMGEIDNTAKFDFLWNDSYLYVAFDIADAHVINSGSQQPWNDDSVEIYIDGDNGKGSYNEHTARFVFRYGDENVYAYGNRSINTQGIYHKVFKTEKGYSMEVAIPWKCIDVKAESGKAVGVTAHINDKDVNDAQAEARGMLAYTAEPSKDSESSVNWANLQFGGAVLDNPVIIETVAESAITIDGVIKEDVWKISQSIDNVYLWPMTDATAKFGTMWNEKYLYVAFDVIDGKVQGPAGNPWDDDGVEIFIDGDLAKGAYNSYTAHLIMRYSDDKVYSYGNADLSTKGILQKSYKTERGYSVEAAIPWENLGITAEDGKKIGFTVHVNDSDAGSEIPFGAIGYTHDVGNDSMSSTAWAEFTLKGNQSEPEYYTINISSDGNGTAGANITTAAEETEITLTAAANSGYCFKEWQVIDGGVTVANNKFIMPANDVTVKAVFEQIPTEPVEPVNPGNTTQTPAENKIVLEDGIAKTRINSTLDSNKKAGVAAISKETLDNMFRQTKENADGTKRVIIEVPEVKDAEAYITKFSEGALSEEDGNKFIEIRTTDATLVVPMNMLKGEKEKGNIELSIGMADKTDITEGIRKKIGERPVIELNLSVGGNTVNWNNPKAPVIVSLKYNPDNKELKKHEHISVWYIDGDGKVNTIPNGRYNPDTGMVTFIAKHFSKYAIAYVEKTFNDLAGYSWAKNCIEVMASKGIISGTTETSFNPGADISRADFITLLVKVLELDAEFSSNFTDVKAEEYYYEAVGIAKALGITAGTGKNMFDPKAPITRQDMMLLVTKALKVAGKSDLKGTMNDIKSYSDAPKVSSYAVESVAGLVKAGIVSGYDNKIDPAGKTTRAQAASIIYKLYNLED